MLVVKTGIRACTRYASTSKGSLETSVFLAGIERVAKIVDEHAWRCIVRFEIRILHPGPMYWQHEQMLVSERAWCSAPCMLCCELAHTPKPKPALTFAYGKARSSICPRVSFSISWLLSVEFWHYLFPAVVLYLALKLLPCLLSLNHSFFVSVVHYSLIIN